MFCKEDQCQNSSKGHIEMYCEVLNELGMGVSFLVSACIK